MKRTTTIMKLQRISMSIVLVLTIVKLSYGQQQLPNTDQLKQVIENEAAKLSPEDIKRIAQSIREFGPSLLQLADRIDQHKRSLPEDDNKGVDWAFVPSEELVEDKHEEAREESHGRKTRSFGLGEANDVVPSITDGILFQAKRFCGFSPQVDPAKLPNAPAAPGQFPWAAAILAEDDSFLCSGTLISESIVLTTASCILKYRNHNQAIKVVLGAWSLSIGQHFPPEIQVFVRTAVLHPSFKQDNPKTFIHDVGLLRLTENVDFDLYPHVFPICIINPAYEQATGTNFCEVLGWPELPEMKHWKTKTCLTAGEVTVQTSGCHAGSDSSSNCVTGHVCVGNQGSPIICLASSQRFYQWGILLQEPKCDPASAQSMTVVTVAENYEFIQKYIWTLNPAASS